MYRRWSNVEVVNENASCRLSCWMCGRPWRPYTVIGRDASNFKMQLATCPRELLISPDECFPWFSFLWGLLKGTFYTNTPLPSTTKEKRSPGDWRHDCWHCNVLCLPVLDIASSCSWTTGEVTLSSSYDKIHLNNYRVLHIQYLLTMDAWLVVLLLKYQKI